MLSLSTGVIVQRCASRMSVVVVEVMRIDYYFVVDVVSSGHHYYFPYCYYLTTA